MATTLAWGEDIEVTMELGFPINEFTLDDLTLGELDGIGKLDGAIEPVDVSEYVTSVSIGRGRPDQLQQFNAGTCSIELINTDRRFDPINEASPYYSATLGRSGIVPRRNVSIKSDTVPIFTGRITDVDITYQPNQATATQDLSTVLITAADDFVLLANTFIEAAITPTEQLSGARVQAVLDLGEVNYPATRNISSGIAGLGGGATFEIASNTTVLSYLQQVAIAENGYFYIAANGDLTFTDRLTAIFANVSAFFDDTNTNIPYTSLDVIYGQEFLYNKVIATIVGGVQQVADDAASQAEFGVSALDLSELLLNNDSAAGVLAADLLNEYKEPKYRFDKLRTIYNDLSFADQAVLSGLEIGDVVEITRTYPTGTPTTVNLQFSIESISHAVTSSAHVVEFGLAATTILQFLVLDDPTLGTLDSTNGLAPSQLLPFVVDDAAVDDGYTFT